MKSQVRLVWPVAGSSIAAAILMVASLIGAAMAMDVGALKRETQLLRSGVAGRVEEINRAAAAQVVRDDAIAHLENAYDPFWARANIGGNLSTSDGFDSAFVLDGANRPEYGVNADADANSQAAYAKLAPLAAPLINEVRRTEARRNSLAPRPWSVVRKLPIQASSFQDIHGQIALVTATLAQPDIGSVRPKSSQAPILITTYPINAAFISALGRRFLVDQVALAPAGYRPSTGLVTISDGSGRPLRNLVWAPSRPGLVMLAQAAAPFSILLAMVVFGGFAFYRHANRTAESLIASEAKATHLALHDFLTGLANRRLFSDRLQQALEQTRRTQHQAAVICLDLDRFKEVNDTFGHHIGDELVQIVGKRLHELCRASDTLARLGGDEFAILMPEATPAGALKLCDRITETFNSPMPLSSGPVRITCSMGISIASGGPFNANELMRQSDLALYRAKDLGRNQHCFYEGDMDAALRFRRALENDLREALATGELELEYQPQIDGSGVMTGVEALLRWTHAERGALSPTVFVPIAEECGLIGELGLFTLRRAFTDSVRWRHLTVAVNVSARQIRLPRFLEDICDLINETGVSPRQFELEITESLLLDDDAHTHMVLRRLKELGFSLALDDFGTGYSSLSYLRRYPIDKIKIDRSFVTNLGDDNESEAVVGAIVRLARALGLDVIAEGVETNQQRDKLIQVGCMEVQGFLFSPPVSGAQIDAFAEGAPFRVDAHSRPGRRRLKAVAS